MKTNNGKTWADLVHENKKTFISLIIFCVLAISTTTYLLVSNGHSVKIDTPIGSFENAKIIAKDSINMIDKKNIASKPTTSVLKKQDAISVNQTNTNGNNYNNSTHEENNIINNFTKPRRMLDQKTFLKILSELGSNKEEEVMVGFVGEDLESKNYASQIVINLKKHGFVNISMGSNDGLDLPEATNDINYVWLEKRELIVLQQY